MSIRIQIDQTVPCSVKKYFLSAKFPVVNFVSKNIHHKAESVACSLILCHTIKLCVRFKNMEKRIHCFLCDNAVLRELVILFRLKFTVKWFEICVLVCTSVLDHVLKFSGDLQRFLISCCIIIGRKSVDCKRLIICMFSSICRFSVICDRPENSAKLSVQTFLFQKCICMICILFQLLLTQSHIGIGKEPQDSAV